MTTITLQRYAVKLDGFKYCGHVAPDGSVALAPCSEPGKETVAYHFDEYVVEAADETHAEAVFRSSMGINKTERDFTVRQVSGTLKAKTITKDDGSTVVKTEIVSLTGIPENKTSGRKRRQS